MSDDSWYKLPLFTGKIDKMMMFREVVLSNISQAVHKHKKQWKIIMGGVRAIPGGIDCKR